MLLIELYFDPGVVGKNNREKNKNQNKGHFSKYYVEISRKNQTMLLKLKIFIIKNKDFQKAGRKKTKLIFQETEMLLKN